MHTTVQDLGRRGHRGMGVPLSGAMDPFALRVANSLIGNPENAAALEFALVGPELEFSEDTLVALGGAECDGLPVWRLVPVKAGERIAPGVCRRGCWGYLAVAGGIDVPQVLGSRSTILRAGIGGFAGRTLHDGDVLKAAATVALRRPASPTWRIDPRVLPPYSPEPAVRVVLGAQAVEFDAGFLKTEWKISQQSDRMGIRLNGTALRRTSGDDLLSAAVAPGTIQVPPDGQPLILMADAQTIGGYPRIAHVIAVDLPLVAQLRPGDRVRFTEVPLDEAHKLSRARERALGILHEGLAQKLS
jgi:antagonist of KipI